MTKPLVVFALEQESQGIFSDHDVLYTGIGKVNAAFRLMRRIHQNRPTAIINLGTAGRAVHKAGSILHVTRFIQRDMDVSPLGFQKWETPFSGEPVILEYGHTISHYPSAVCGTGDSFDISHDGKDYDLVDMEAFALARVCKEENIPFLCLKYISDGADGSASTDWNDALSRAAHALKGALESVLPFPLR